MATIEQVEAQCKFLREKGRGQEKAHLVLVEQEARERIANAGPKPKTRFQFETDSPQAYAEFNREKDRYLREAVNKQIGIDAMLAALAAWSDEQIKTFAEGEEALR